MYNYYRVNKKFGEEGTIVNKNNCLICNEEVLYLSKSEKLTCYYCKNEYESSMVCKNGHYVCDNCHSKDALTVINEYCNKSISTNPINMAIDLMKHPAIKMHGPEHHFLVPAVLISAYLNKVGKIEDKERLLNEGKKRSKNVLGGFCGFYGACGAGVGCGIYMSLILEATPLSKESWGICNLMTSKSLENISSFGGPRCCKRDSFVAIKSAIDFTEEYLNVELDKNENILCEFMNLNKECLKEKCKFYNEGLVYA